jgi:hypothetical protein
MDMDELERRIGDSLPQATKAKERWAIKILNNWKENRLQAQLNGTTPRLMVIKPLEKLTKAELNELLQYFVFEVRKISGEKYPPGTLKDLVSMIQHYYQYSMKMQVSIWTDDEFLMTRRALDAAMRETSREGNLNGVRSSVAIGSAEEQLLWDQDVLGDKDPKQLVFSVIFLIGKVFGLRGGRELHCLEYNKEINLAFEQGEEILVYRELTVSKSRQGGLRTYNRPIKQNRVFHTANHRKCLVCLYKKYVALRPDNCTKSGLFLNWYRNAASVQAGKWYQNQVIGRHMLDSVVKTLTSGLPKPAFGRYSNHSLRKTCATTLRDAGFERAEIGRVTGHSSKALENYIEPSAAVAKAASNILQGAAPCGDTSSADSNKSVPFTCGSSSFDAEKVGSAVQSVEISNSGSVRIIFK